MQACSATGYGIFSTQPWSVHESAKRQQFGLSQVRQLSIEAITDVFSRTLSTNFAGDPEGLRNPCRIFIKAFFNPRTINYLSRFGEE